MDWKLSLWSSVELFEQARSPGRVVRVDQETKVGFNHLVSFSFSFLSGKGRKFRIRRHLHTEQLWGRGCGVQVNSGSLSNHHFPLGSWKCIICSAFFGWTYFEELLWESHNLNCDCRCPTTVVKQKWMSHLYQHACDQKRWKEAALDKMEVKFNSHGKICQWIFQVLSPDTKTGAGRSVGRTRSKLLLHYNETKIWVKEPITTYI